VNKASEIWEKSPATSELSENLVHIWKARIDDSALDVDKLHMEILSQDEKKRVSRLRSAKDKMRFIVSRSLLRKSLSHYLDASPSEVRFIYNKYGKPNIDPEYHQENIRFNLSHSENLALYAITQNREIGIDVEYIRKVDKADKIVKRFFSKEEGEFYYSQPDRKKNWAFFTLWTRKEAYSKARGMGIGLPTKEFDLQLVPTEVGHTNNIRTRNKESKWSLINIEIDSDYLAALATEGNDFKISHWKFEDI
jgi:4'-phosphopantetheinyl transferase